MKLKIYRLINAGGQMPYEIYVWDPKSDEPMPDWFSDILKLKYFNENGNPEFSYNIDDKGGITYQVPATNGHIYIKKDEIVVKEVYSGIIYPFKKSLFNKLYEKKLSKWEKLVNSIRMTWNTIVGNRIYSV